jgi:hypothetical protein
MKLDRLVQGEVASFVAIVLSGSLVIRSDCKLADENIRNARDGGIVLQGHLVGEFSLFEGGTRTANVLSREPRTSLMLLEYDAINHLAESQHEGSPQHTPCTRTHPQNHECASARTHTARMHPHTPHARTHASAHAQVTGYSGFRSSTKSASRAWCGCRTSSTWRWRWSGSTTARAWRRSSSL